ncbi:MAG: alpha-galactosidase [Chloroflexi bacterium]|nr:alpha-galactosidase [Chloroflexota bacterium]
MKIAPTPDHSIRIEFSNISLSGLRPVVNGVALNDAPVQVVHNDARGSELNFSLPDGAFGVEVTRENESRVWLRYWIANPSQNFALDSFGIRFAQIENLRAYLRNGYTSWDGSFYVEPDALRAWEEYETRPETGFAMTQLVPRSGASSVILGFDRHERFQHTFTFDTRSSPTALTIQTLWDRKPYTGRYESERLVIFEHPEIEDALREWARIVADASHMLSGIVAKPHHAEPITGWCSWYNLYGYINEENILAHLRGAEKIAREENVALRVFQIDDGFTPEMGDWLDVKPQFPRGIKPLLDDIRAAGFVPGLWIAPFVVGNRSRLYREHPDWVVRERATDAPLAQWKLYGENRWHKRSEEYYILDTTHPDAFEYLRRVFRVWRREWGSEYFKTDFMYWGAEYGPDRARWHTPGMTRIEIWRRVAEMIREEIGDATWLGCGCPLWASVGLVDGVRIGGDVGVEWRGHLSAQSLLRDQATRNFANHILWQTDPDCILLRDRFHHLTDAEVRALALYAGMTGGVRMTSDALDELSPERLRLCKFLVNSPRATCHFPFLAQSPTTYERLPSDLHSQRVRHEPVADPVLVQVRTPATGDGVAAIFIFNTGETPTQRTYSLDALGIAGTQYVYDWINQTFEIAKTSKIAVTLAPHDGVLLFTSPTPITTAPEHLP